MITTELLMPTPPPPADRRMQAKGVIQVARGMLDQPEEEMVVLYLDHAIEALHMIGEQPRPSALGLSGGVVSSPATAPEPDRGLPAPARGRRPAP